MVEVEDSILFWAFRYALGRMTYVVGDVGDCIIRNVDVVDEEFKKNVVREIREKEYKNELGMEMDKKCWIEVKNILLKSLKGDE